MAYLNITEVESALRSLASTYPLFCQLIELTHTTLEGRTSYAVRLGTGAPSNRDGILVIGNLHGREWGSADIAVNFAADLLEAYTNGLGLSYGGKSFSAAQIRAIMEGLNIFVFPCVNPDGRHYSQTVNNMWRPNRNGVDLNRNFDFLWDFTHFYSPSANVRTLDNPGGGQDSTYHGPSAASEPEVRNVVSLLDDYPRIRWLMDLHSYSMLVMYTWGDDEDQTSDPLMNFANAAYDADRGVDGDVAYKEYIPPTDLTVFQSTCNRMAGAIQAVRGSVYTVQQSFGLYPTSGSSDDYAYSRCLVDASKNKIGSFCIEWGTEFQPPWAEMEQIIQDISSGLVELCLAAPCEGSIVTVDLVTPSISFHDVPENETTSRAVVFSVRACPEVHLRITSGPAVITGPSGTAFGTPLGASVTVPVSTDPTTPRPARVWISYTGTHNGDTATGTVTIECTETGGTWDVDISANTIARPTVALEMILDKSNSMNWASGLTPPLETRIKALHFAASPLTDLMPEGDSIGIVSFDHDAYHVMSPTPVGPLVSGAGRIAARIAIENHNPNPMGWTSIGDGLLLAHADLEPIAGYDLKASVVLTDGHENRPAFIADVAGIINERIYAIGIGTAEIIQPAALAAVTNGTGGYLLLTGTLTDDNNFLLNKYYLQILAGVTNAEIILDPDSWIRPGDKHRIPFRLGETDYGTDIIVLSPSPEVLGFILETPSGAIIDPGMATPGSGIQFVASKNIQFYRITLPVRAGGVENQAGGWHAVLTVDEAKWRRCMSKMEKDNIIWYRDAKTHGVRYNLSVQANSNLRMAARLSQNSFEPGATMVVRAVFTEYGLPVEMRAKASAELERPDGTKTSLVLNEIEPGVLEAILPAQISGIYRLRVVGTGRTLRGTLFTREQLLTGAVWRNGDKPSPTSTENQQERDERLCHLLLCLLSRKTISLELEERLKKLGLNISGVRSCLKEYCQRIVNREKSLSSLIDSTGTMTNQSQIMDLLRQIVKNYEGTCCDGTAEE